MNNQDTRSVTVTNDSVIIDGRAVGIRVQADGRPPRVVITGLSDTVLYSGSAVVTGVPLDGIERLRKRLGQ